MPEITKYGIRKIDTPIGILYAISTKKGIIKITTKKQNENNTIGEMHLNNAEEWFKSYFKGDEIERPLLDYQEMTVFRKNVLNKLTEKILFGEIISYGRLAILLEKKGASRAVGTALSKNPWPIIVPCHRVINNNGEIGKYSGINNILGKKMLLKHEGLDISDEMILINGP
jgi:methylated-DNA-[protein]-cysteine S-methyltransferase